VQQATEASGTFFYVLKDELRLLYVDDDPILREFAQVHLTTETATVETAADGVAGLAALASVQPDVVLLDLDMPRMDGFEVLTHMRADPAHANTPVIVATGREDVGAIDRAFQLGATSFVVKPVNWRLLSYQIRYVHRTHQAQTALAEDAGAAREALERVTQAGSRFLAQALSADPALKSAAAPYLAALEDSAAVARRSAGS
jgi:DNA-binding response OmpR family regulator